MNSPDFFIVGAPKCGTTSLADYLAERADVVVSEPKEPHFYATDLEGYRGIKSKQDYLAMFESKPAGGLAGEASVFYLYSSTALQHVRRDYPDARIIIMLRNPVHLVHAFHSQLLYTNDENVTDFMRAWELCEPRRRGLHVPKKCRAASILSYDCVGLLGEQLQRAYSLFPRDQVLVIFFSDFVSGTSKEFQRVQSFLGLTDDGRTEFPNTNPSKRHRSRFLADLLFEKSRYLRRPVSKLKKMIGIERFGFIDRLRQWETVFEARTPLSEEQFATVYRAFESDIALLSQLTARDLSGWAAGKP